MDEFGWDWTGEGGWLVWSQRMFMNEEKRREEEGTKKCVIEVAAKRVY